MMTFIHRLSMLLPVVILLSAGRLTAGAEAAAAPEHCQRVLILYSDADESNRNLIANIRKVFDTVKINSAALRCDAEDAVAALRRMGPDDLLVIATSEWSEVINQTGIIEFVRGGGKVFCPVLGFGSAALLNMTGGNGVRRPERSSGLVMTEPFFPGLEYTGAWAGKINAAYVPLSLDPHAEVLLRSVAGQPLAWSYRFGKGEVAVCDLDLLSDINFAGLLMQLVTRLNDYFLYTVFNAKVIFIDDFPFPIPLGSEFIITSNYDGRSYEEFYREIWWPQIKDIARKYGFKYTCLVLANYENSVKMPPPPLDDRVKGFIRYYGNDLLAEGYELGIHGYNHASLLMAAYERALRAIGYSPWASVADMETSLRELKRTLDQIFGPRLYFTYVPPMNMMATAGKKAVIDVFPGLRCIAGIGDLTVQEEGELHQDVGPDPEFPSVYDLPRYSNGYVYRAEDMATIFNYVACYGLFSHFIHPDDLLDAERSENKNWQELYEEMTRIVREVHEGYPFLRGMSAQEFVEERFRTDPIKVYTSRRGNEISIRYVNGDGPLYHYLTLNHGLKIRTVVNGAARPIGKSGRLYLIEGRKSPVRIVTESSRPANSTLQR